MSEDTKVMSTYIDEEFGEFRKITPAEMVLAIGAVRDAIKSVFGTDAVQERIALAKSIDIVSKYYNTDLSTLNAFLPPDTHVAGHLTTKQISKKFGFGSAKTFNRQLEELGLQYKNAKGNWVLTKEGNHYGEMVLHTNPNGGNTGYYPLWNDSVVELLAKNLPF